MRKLYFVSILSALLFLLSSCTSTPAQEEPTTSAPTASDVKQTQKPLEDDEYAKAISEMSDSSSISKDMFEEDRKTILAIINELSEIMNKKNYSKWTSYIDPASLTYWKNPANLKKAAGRLPVKGIQLKNLEDYFTFVFIPARKGHIVSQIRYINDKSVKAVQVSEDNTIVVYYNFIKLDNRWMVQLPVIN